VVRCAPPPASDETGSARVTIGRISGGNPSRGSVVGGVVLGAVAGLGAGVLVGGVLGGLAVPEGAGSQSKPLWLPGGGASQRVSV
jgi:hypothetical protein